MDTVKLKIMNRLQRTQRLKKDQPLPKNINELHLQEIEKENFSK